MATFYTELDLRKLKGQALKDTWHAMIGKPPGLKNTTGLANSEEILQAILKGQEDPDFLKRFGGRAKPVEAKSLPDMPPKERKKPVPKKTSGVPLKKAMAIESMDLPEIVESVVKIRVHKLVLEDQVYFLDSSTQKVYTVVEGRPGQLCGTWDPETRFITPEA
jgi:hypothetical protein